MRRCYLALGVAVVLISFLGVRLASGGLREADLQRMSDEGYRSELNVVRQDKGPFSAGDQITIKLEVKNTGSVTWKKDKEHCVTLGGFTRKPIDVLTNREGHANSPQLRISPGIDVNPGKSFSVEVKLEGLAAGKYEQRFQMVKEGKPPLGGWFGPIVTYRFQVQQPRSQCCGYARSTLSFIKKF